MVLSFTEDDSRNVYTGELEVRPPGAPTTPSRGNRPVADSQRSYSSA